MLKKGIEHYPEILSCVFSCYISFIKITHVHANNDVNEEIMNKIKEAGCPPRNSNQFLLNNVCLMPDYQSHEPPANHHGKTLVDVHWYLEAPQVIEIEEKKNKITIQIAQVFEWEDTRIKTNYSAISSLQHATSYFKISPNIVEKIWHPYLDLITYNIQEKKSVNAPLWFYSFGIAKCLWTRNCNLSPDMTKLYADTRLTATLFCKFDFYSFPFDTQNCKFYQAFESSSELVHIFLYDPASPAYSVNLSRPVFDWNYTGIGFDITITTVGTLVDPNSTMQNSTGDFGFDVKLQRIIQPYLFQYYFPCAAIVIISQISFTIPISAIPGRVGVIVTQFLTLTNIFIYQMVRWVYKMQIIYRFMYKNHK